jgi:hypothetical protein
MFVRTSDDVKVDVEKEILCKSNLISNMLNDLEIEDELIPIPSVSLEVLNISMNLT